MKNIYLATQANELKPEKVSKLLTSVLRRLL